MMNTVLERNTRNVVVRMSNKRWNLLLDLEAAYHTAQKIMAAKKECEISEPMKVEEALRFIDNL